ncbi:hypothetical protein ApDm4_2763 [Acetobacter pomorum]|nr:hypothetical protein ApDm4_2763 [Acetobacter pomorum]
MWWHAAHKPIVKRKEPRPNISRAAAFLYVEKSQIVKYVLAFFYGVSGYF